MSQVPVNLISAIVGALAIALIAFFLYRSRDRLSTIWGGVGESIGRQRTRISRGQGARYREAVIEQANGWHIAGHLVPLDQIGIPPSFLPLPRPFDPYNEADSDEIEGPYGLVPFVLDYPQLAAIYGLPGIGLAEVLAGVPAIALLGVPGSGRSTALAMMASLAAQEPLGAEEMLTPVLFHLGDVNLSPDVLQEEVDPADIMAAAVQKRLGGRAARIAPNLLPQAMASGDCLVLADGWDELPAPQRIRTLAWIQVLMEAYPDNRYVIAGPARGFKLLLESRLVPVGILPWTERDFATLIQRWSDAWPTLGAPRRDRNEPPEPELVRRLALGNRARSILDVTLKSWTALAGYEGIDRRDWYDAFVDEMLPVPETRDALQRLAVEAIKSGAAGMLGRPEDEVIAFLESALAWAGRGADVMGVLKGIVDKSPLLVERADKRYSFVHPLLAGFLASETLAGSNLDVLQDAEESLEVTVPFLAASGTITELVDQCLSEEPEILYDNLLQAAVWAADAPQDAPWRAQLFSRLEDILVSPSQYPLIRERMLAGLVASRSREMVEVFRQAVRAEEPVSRMLAVLGLGALGSPELVPTVVEMLADVDPRVQVASALALGAIGDEAAVEIMVELLFEGSELVRQAVAESMASNTNVGHQLLREAIVEQDVLVRRAAVFGLARVGEPWALDILRERQTADDQWFVRDASSDALQNLAVGAAKRQPKPIPLPEEMGWLLDWAADRGEGVSSGPRAIESLIHALQDGNDDVRYTAADTLGKVGSLESIPPLYSALQDTSPLVRDIAYRALAFVSQSTGRPLPAVL